MPVQKVRIQIGDRHLYVEPKTANKVRAKRAELKRKDRQISLELRQAHITQNYHAPHQKITGSGYARPNREINNVSQWHRDKKAHIEKEFQRINLSA